MPGTTHAAVRAAERLGIIADRKWFDEVVDQILSGRAKRVHAHIVTNLADHSHIYDVEVSTGKVRVVFDPRPGEQVVVTVLPPEFQFEKFHRLQKQDAKRKREFFRGFEDEEESWQHQ